MASKIKLSMHQPRRRYPMVYLLSSIVAFRLLESNTITNTYLRFRYLKTFTAALRRLCFSLAAGFPRSDPNSHISQAISIVPRSRLLDYR